ncbi:MAG: dihydropteroate synthase [Nevskia sp.]|nr:dihydropteroate synthase [Nevskia sp.]
MGILNLTPDSFSDGGRHAGAGAALAHAQQMVAEGAAIVDVGGESTRPGAEPVAEQEELDRTIPVVERLVRELDCVVSIDTRKPAVMRAACAAGAEIVNDVNALRAPGAVDAVLRHRAAAVLMHMRGEPRGMQQAPAYADLVGEVRDFLAQRLRACVEAGIPALALALDPGFGFGKTLQHNLQLMAALEVFASLGRPLLVGVSRKSMLGAALGLPVDRRLHAGIAAAALAVWQGAAIVRTHDVGPTVEAVKLVAAIRQERRAQAR